MHAKLPSNAIEMYNQLCRIDLINNGLDSAYPYTLQDESVFTQHEIELHYKQNYCKTIRVLEETTADTKEVAGGQPQYVYFLWQ